MKEQRWLRRKDERAPEILDAALACFAEKGFAASRMDDIARRAGISKGTIYLYFESKEAVFKALAQRAIGERIEAIAGQLQAVEGSTPDLLRMVLTMVGSIVSTSDAVVLPRLVISEAGIFPELAEFWRKEIIDRGLGVFEAVIRRGQSRGRISRHAAATRRPPVRRAAAGHHAVARRFRPLRRARLTIIRGWSRPISRRCCGALSVEAAT